ncbi:hypothetical protein pb186bvf_001867 [Paramecium bursaria]
MIRSFDHRQISLNYLVMYGDGKSSILKKQNNSMMEIILKFI